MNNLEKEGLLVRNWAMFNYKLVCYGTPRSAYFVNYLIRYPVLLLLASSSCFYPFNSAMKGSEPGSAKNLCDSCWSRLLLSHSFKLGFSHPHGYRYLQGFLVCCESGSELFYNLWSSRIQFRKGGRTTITCSSRSLVLEGCYAAPVGMGTSIHFSSKKGDVYVLSAAPVV